MENNDVKGAADSRMRFADGLRGLAAMWVVLFHLSEGHHIDALRAQLPLAVNRVLFDWGHGGVGIFFVLSGFVMALTVERAAMDGAGAGRFVLRRLIRLCPPYWLAIAVSSVMLAAKGTPVHAGQLLANVFFAQGLLGFDNISIVFWTLCIEIQFYIAFAAMTWLSDRIAPAAGRGIPRVMIALLSLAWPVGMLVGPLWTGGFLPFWVFFMAGVLVFEANRRAGSARWFGVAFGAVLLGLGLHRYDLFSAIAGLTTLGLIASGAGTGMQTWLSGRALQFLGSVSYSLYLFHNPVTGTIFRAMGKLTGRHNAVIDLLCSTVAIGACLGIAWAIWFTVERASIRWSRLVSTRPRAVPAAVGINTASN